jgi:phospholipid/cholesterol/gamma-HCH transport system permease protein
VNQSVVITFVLTFMINLIMTTVYLQLFPAKGV